jgi:hypothetical protein
VTWGGQANTKWFISRRFNTVIIAMTQKSPFPFQVCGRAPYQNLIDTRDRVAGVQKMQSTQRCCIVLDEDARISCIWEKTC